jgi:hypothetical protein
MDVEGKKDEIPALIAAFQVTFTTPLTLNFTTKLDTNEQNLSLLKEICRVD